MKRLALAALAATFVLGASAPAALAHDGDATVQNVQWRDRDYRDNDRGTWVPWHRDRDRQRYRNRSSRGFPYGSGYSVDPRLAHDPVFQRLQNSRAIHVNNFFEGGRYRTSGQRFSPDILRMVGYNRDGSYQVWFNGQMFPAYARTYGHRQLLYVGNAPTSQGYLYELILE